MSTVRAKFWVSSINYIHNGDQKADQCAEVRLSPVYGSGNEPWSKYTPQGEIKMLITDPAAIDAFVLGKSYFIDFAPAD